MKSLRDRHEKIDILLVEDNTDEAYLIGACFDEAKFKHVLHTIADGADALDFLYKRDAHENAPRPNLIILDLRLPKMDGRDVLAQIKEDEDYRRIPVVVLSGSRDEKLKRECLDLHANCYLSKPHMAGDFLKTVRQIRDFWFSYNGPELIA